jgi:hypothetical protein
LVHRFLAATFGVALVGAGAASGAVEPRVLTFEALRGIVTVQANHAVRATGTPVEMIVFPVNGHNPSDPLHREERTHLWIDWFAKHF